MIKNVTWFSKVSDGMNCPKCKEKKVIKNGRTKNNKQQYPRSPKCSSLALRKCL